MPRKAPTEVIEQRITFGNYERQFVTEVKNDIEKSVKIATVSAFAIPIAGVAGLGLLGYGLLKAGQAIGKGLNEFSLMNWETPDVVKDIKDSWTGIKWGINPFNTPPKEYTNDEIIAATEDYSWVQKQELWLYITTGGKYGKSKQQLDAEIYAVQQGGGGGDF